MISLGFVKFFLFQILKRIFKIKSEIYFGLKNLESVLSNRKSIEYILELILKARLLMFAIPKLDHSKKKTVLSIMKFKFCHLI